MICNYVICFSDILLHFPRIPAVIIVNKDKRLCMSMNFSRIWFDVFFVLMYSVKQELVNKKSCFLGKSHLILYSLGLR